MEENVSLLAFSEYRALYPKDKGRRAGRASKLPLEGE
jgi:hypothetical protein